MDEDKLLEMCEEIAKMRADLNNAIDKVTEHIKAGSTYRLAIVCACIGLIGTMVGGVVRFSVMEYKVAQLQCQQDRLSAQIYDLNYEKGRAVGIEEGKANK